MIVRTSGVILKSMDFRESSRILTVYTRDFGKQSILAKGVRGPKSRLAGVTGPLNYVSLVYYRKEQRELQLLSQCDLVRPWRALSDSLEAMGAAMAICELLNMVVQGEEEHPALFELLVRSLDAVNGARANAVNAFFLFEIRLVDLLGFRPELRRCARCGTEIPEGGGELAFDLHRGSVVCADCAVQGGEGLSAAAHSLLCRLQEISDVDAVCRISLSPALRSEVGAILRRYLQAHVDGLRSLRSESVFSALL
jgi:DNA repair protein RecO (recombination protein O)